MSNLELLNRSVLHAEKRGILTEDEYSTYKNLLEAVERVEAFQRVCSELTGMNPFLAGEFYKNKTVLEKLK